MSTRVMGHVVALAAVVAMTPAARAAIGFDVSGLAGTGVTAHVNFAYTSTSATSGLLRFVIENTTAVGGRISGFAFNIPTLGGSTLASIAAISHGSGVLGLGGIPSQVTPENQAAGFSESGWYGLWENNGIKTPNAAGHFDFGIMNAGHNPNNFITDGVGSGPRITNTADGNDSTTFVLQVTGAGLNTGDAAIEQAFMNALSSPQNQGTGYNFAVRFQGIGNSSTLGSSDLAVSTVVVPAPTAAALGSLGLGLIGWVCRRRR